MDKIELLKIKIDTAIKCLPESPFRGVVSWLYDELFAEIELRDNKIKELNKLVPKY